MVDQAEIHRKSLSDKVEDRIEAASRFRIDFDILPHKDAAWLDLHRLSGDDSVFVRKEVAVALGAAFLHFSDKDIAWQDLIRLTGDVDRDVRGEAAYALCDAFPHTPDKNVAWQDLHRLSGEEDGAVRRGVAYALGVAFPHASDKNVAWQDLHRLSGDEDGFVRMGAAYALGAAFSQVPDKDAAWQDLHRLSGDKDGFVRMGTAVALGAAFSQVPDKDAAWQDLHRLSGEEDLFMRMGAALSLGAAFPFVPDKEVAWEVMVNLSKNHGRNVRVFANHSLGRASIFKATEAKDEEDFRKELEKALEYFEKSAAEAGYYNPSKFCLPFYRSFYVLTFKEEGSEAEVQKYLAKAKSASEGSKSKEDLLEAVENLSNALKETQSLQEMGFEAAKCDLDAYRRYCDRAAELLDETEERAPGATRLIKKKLPRVDHEITDLLENIKNKSEHICKTGDPFEAELGCKIQKHATYALGKTCNPIRVQKEVNCMLSDFDLWSNSVSDLYSRKCIKAALEEAEREEETDRQLSIIRRTLQVVMMSGKDTSNYVIKDSTVQIAEGVGHDQKMNVSSNTDVKTSQNTSENAKDNRPWYKDRNYLIAVVGVLFAIAAFLAEIL